MSLQHIRSTDLLQAVLQNRIEEVEERLGQKEDINRKYAFGRFVLQAACNNLNIKMVEVLLNHKANVNQVDSQMNTALHSIARKTGDEARAIASKLLSKKANVEARNALQQTPLHVAALAGNQSMVELLLSAGAQADAQDAQGNMPRNLAFSMKHYKVVEQLAGKTSPKSGASGAAPTGAGAAAGCKGGAQKRRSPDRAAVSEAVIPPAVGAGPRMFKSVEEEKAELKRRLRELEEEEDSKLEERLKAADKELAEKKRTFRIKKEDLTIEISNLQDKLTQLVKEEEEEVGRLESLVKQLTNKSVRKPQLSPEEALRQLESTLECPVCLDVCRPPRHIMQCKEGHIVCGNCAANPDLTACPQCRVSIAGQLSRCRTLEELARKAFPETKPGTEQPQPKTEKPLSVRARRRRRRGLPPVQEPEDSSEEEIRTQLLLMDAYDQLNQFQ